MAPERRPVYCLVTTRKENRMRHHYTKSLVGRAWHIATHEARNIRHGHAAVNVCDLFQKIIYELNWGRYLFV